MSKVYAKDFMVSTLSESEPKQYAKKLEKPLKAVLNLNEFQYDLPKKVVEAIKNEAVTASKYVYYGDGLTGKLIEKTAEYVGVTPDCIALDESLDQALNRLPKIFVNKGENIIMMSPTYPELFYGNRRAGGVTKKVALDMPEFDMNPDRILEACDKDTRMIFLCSPNNPTGVVAPKEDIMKVVENAPCVVLVDECYYEYCQETVADEVNNYPNLYVLRSFSKGFGLAGAKMSYIISNPENTAIYNKIMSGFEYNRFGTAGALAALDSIKEYQAIWNEINSEKERTRKELSSVGYKVWKSGGIFGFIDISASGLPGDKVQAILRDDHGILVRNVASTFTELENKYISFATGKREINDEIISTLKSLAE